MGSGSSQLPTPAVSVGIDGIYQSINLLSDPICSQPMQLRQNNESGGSAQVFGTDIAQSLTGWALSDKEKFLWDCLTSGNGFAAVRRNSQGGVDRLETISAHRVTVAVDAVGNVWYELVEDTEVNLSAETIAAKDMIHLKYRVHSRHTAIGQSPLITLAPSLEKVVVINQSGTATYRNFAAPGLILSTPNELGGGVKQRVLEGVQQGASGSNQGKTMVLDNGIEPKTINRSTALDMQLAELDSVNIKSLSRVYGIPAALLGESQATAYNTSAELIRSFHSLTLKPFARRIGDCLSRVLLDDEQRATGLHIAIDMASLIRGEGVELADYLSKLTNSGVTSVNEARQLVGLEDVSGGDMLRSPVNVMPLSTWQDYEPGGTQDQPAPASDGDQKVNSYRKSRKSFAINKLIQQVKTYV